MHNYASLSLSKPPLCTWSVGCQEFPCLSSLDFTACTNVQVERKTLYSGVIHSLSLDYWLFRLLLML
jgi:hypothetical protein